MFKKFGVFILYMCVQSFFAECVKTIPTNDVILLSASSADVEGDGISMDTVYASLPNNSVTASSYVLFKTSTGLFDNGFDTMTVLANRQDINPKYNTAVARITTSLRDGLDTVTATTVTNPPFMQMINIVFTKSAPAFLIMQASAFTVATNFGSEVTITGTLLNSSRNRVSDSTLVQFTDYYQSSGLPVGGSYRQLQNASNDSSQLSFIYSSGLAPPGSFIYIKGVVLDSNGMPTAIADSVLLYITP
jgi:hypothetical protein